MSDTNELALSVYADGTDPLDWAVWLAECQIDAREEVLAARYENPAAFPGYPMATSITATARAIVGRLLDAGWTPPTVP